MAPVEWQVAVGDDATTAVFEPASNHRADALFVCAHGAGGHMGDRSVVAVTTALRERGLDTVRFNFLYRTKRQGRPDPMPRLVACLNAVVARVRAEIAPSTLLLGGRSMGGRAASVSVSQGARCDGLLLLAYPLHPPGQPGKLRVEHLASIPVPVLCLSGTNDPFATPALMENTVAGLGDRWQLHWLAQADHSFHVLKRSGRTNDEIVAEAADVAAAWVSHLPGRVSHRV